MYLRMYINRCDQTRITLLRISAQSNNIALSLHYMKHTNTQRLPYASGSTHRGIKILMSICTCYRYVLHNLKIIIPSDQYVQTERVIIFSVALLVGVCELVWLKWPCTPEMTMTSQVSSQKDVHTSLYVARDACSYSSKYPGGSFYIILRKSRLL